MKNIYSGGGEVKPCLLLHLGHDMVSGVQKSHETLW